MKTKQTNLYIGLNDKETKAQKIDTIEAYKIVYNILLNNGINGATIYNAMGIYKHDNGDVVFENTLKVELIEATSQAVEKSITEIKKAFNQESVIYSDGFINSILK